MFTNRLFVLIVVLAVLTVGALTIQAGIATSAAAPSRPNVRDWNDFVDRRQGTLADMHLAATSANLPQHHQRLSDLNEIYYPSDASEPTFWSGRPH